MSDRIACTNFCPIAQLEQLTLNCVCRAGRRASLQHVQKCAARAARAIGMLLYLLSGQAGFSMACTKMCLTRSLNICGH